VTIPSVPRQGGPRWIGRDAAAAFDADAADDAGSTYAPTGERGKFDSARGTTDLAVSTIVFYLEQASRMCGLGDHLQW
jgi:hypothetical protein